MRKCPDVTNYTKPIINTWTKDDTNQLYRGLTEFGEDFVKDIKRVYLPHKKETTINYQIQKWKVQGKENYLKTIVSKEELQNCGLTNSVKKLDEWIEHFENVAGKSSSPSALSQMFLLISEYGNFPKPEECEGIDFR